ncbi:pyridoxamine 5'-phosphate oxidase family protein [Microbacterium rhizomatis]|uniref:Pyridoxamine 5'-phosphate oxidase family protein n=1 Tax=Microbacterium rhizomatis TaxID=1631477 RepID=A0A5J5J5W2_9MICO|nr:pyridoxamine 5'-phosphate oxidase family protein [Microbacterium rhizomatis]KAA9111411.1 pyridoxamine 5'-phosphate oxidase family protein [Microbacterium rhizomatis]
MNETPASPHSAVPTGRPIGASATDPNPYLAMSIPPPPSAAESGVEELTVDQCWQMLQSEDLGRVAIDNIDGTPDLFPVNYLVRDEKLYFRSAPGRKLRSIAQNPEVAFEVDGRVAGIRWSVVVRGTAERMNVDAEITEAGVLDLVSASPTRKFNFIRLTPGSVSGRRFRVPPRPRGSSAEAGAIASVSETGHRGVEPTGSRSTKPLPIPHISPRP